MRYRLVIDYTAQNEDEAEALAMEIDEMVNTLFVASNVESTGPTLVDVR